MASQIESATSETAEGKEPQPSSWLKVGAVAAASALAGGLAAAWFYRKTLTRLRQAESLPPNPAYRSQEDDAGEDT
jgi:hypothetical protein